MYESNYLKNHFLIAMPKMEDSNFSRAVIYVSEHNEEGAMGFVINHLLDVTFGDVLEQLEIKSGDDQVKEHPVLSGGPVQTHQGFILHENEDKEDATNPVSITASLDLLKAIAKGKGPTPYLMTLGYAGWGAGQLEEEMAKNCWLSCPADKRILFETPYAHRWKEAAALMGVDPSKLSGDIGHA